jgi:large repetitive protein
MKKNTLLSFIFTFCTIFTMIAQPANDNCASATNLGSLPTPGACSGGLQNGTATSSSGTITGATPASPYVYQTGCSGGSSTATFANDVWYRFTATGTTVNISISGTISNPNIAFYEGTCGNLGGRGCNIGTAGGNGSLTITQIQIGQVYYIQVSGNSSGAGGNFTLNVDNDIDCDNCLTTSTLTASPQPVNGAYQPGQVVTFCYKITGYTHQNTNWLHGVQIAFGSGWQGISGQAAAADCGGSGTWGYYAGGTTSSANGNSWPAGFYFDYDGFPSGPGDGNPGNNLGDNCAATGSNLWTFCFNLTVKSACSAGSNLSVTINTSGDGESGSWTSLGCSGDPATIFTAVGACCPPTMASTTTCVGQTTGTATATPVGAGAPFTYSWAPGGQTTQTATGLAAGTYTVTVTSATNCAVTATVVVPTNPTPVSTFTDPPDQCLTGNSFTFTNTGSSGAGFTQTWNFGGAVTNTSTAVSPTGVTYASAGTYTITHTVTSTAGCTSTTTSTVVVNPLPLSTFTDPPDQCLTGNSFTFTNTGNSGAGFSQTWNFGGAITNTSTAVSPTGVSYAATGTYTITHTVTNTATGCTSTTTSTVTVTANPTSTFTQTANTCLTGNTFNFTNTGTGGASQTWTFGGAVTNTSTAVSPTGVTYAAAGTYTITHVVTAAGGCTSTTTSTVTVYAQPTAIVMTPVNSTCGSSNGSVTLGAVTGGTSPYTYSFNGSGFTATTSYTALAAGTYPVIVKDVNGCTYTTSVTIANTPGPTALAVTSVNSTCGASNGVINIGAVTGGTAPYTYSVNASAFTATLSYTGFAAGTYNVIVKDANGCTFTRTIVVSNTPGPTALAVTSVNSTCGASNGVINIGAVTGGTSPYTYSVNASAFTATLSYTGFAAGTYNVIVKDANGCTFTRTIVVSNTPGPTALAVTNTNASCGASNGTITVGAVTGGTSAYTYSVNGSAFTATTAYSGYAAGTYTVIVKDANGCTFSTTTTIVNSSGPTALVVNSTNSTCGNSNGTATIGATTGGVAPLTYSFNGSGFTATTNYTALAAGTYPVVVKDNNGCTFTTSVTVANTPGPTAIASTPVNANCGLSNGSVTLGAVTGGTSPYTYSFNGSGFTATTSYTALAAGSYAIIVKDANGCTFTTSVTVGNTPGPTALATSTVNSTCGASNGVINIGAVTGGTAAYTYSVNASAFTATTSYTGFAAGTYNVIVKDANGCTFTTTATVVNTPGPTALATTTVNSTCGAANGTVNIGAITGGTAAYVYSFDASAFTATTSYTGLAAGSHTIIVKDANGCTFTTSATIVNTPGPTALAVTTVNSTCGNSNGVINIGAVTGGTSAYTYSVAASAFTATTSYPGFAAGTYTIVVKDANGCTFTTSATIANSPGPTAIASSTINSNCGASNGTITLGAVTGGVPAYTYSVDGSLFTATTIYNGFAAGTYPIIVKDANGCTFTTSASVSNSSGPTALAVTSTNSTCGSSNGTATIGAVTGGSAPYTYSFNASAFTATTNYTSVAAGTYNVIVKDNNGCTFATTVTVNNNPGPTALAVTTINSTCGASNGVINIGAVTGGTAAYTYSVNASAFTATVSYPAFAAGTYTVIVKDANGCTFSTTATVVNTPGPTAIATTLTNTTCGNSNGSVVLGAVTGGTSAYTYSFNGSGFTATTTYSALAAGTYPIVVKDANGCTFTTSATLTNTPGPTALATTFTNPTCGNNNGTITIGTVTGGTPTYTYSFNGGGFTATTSYTALAAGTYPIIVQDANGCQFTVNRTITNVPGPTALVTTTTNASCGASNGSATIGAVTGGTAPYTYSFNGGAFGATTSFPGLAANTYPVIVQDANGCQFTTSATVNNSSGPTALAVAHTDATCGNSNGTATIGATTGGVLPLSYSFNGGAFSSTTNYTNLAAGTYAVIVKDNNGCTFTTSVIISNIPGPTALAVTTVNTTCGAANGSITIGAVTGGTTAYTYSINASAFTATTNYTSLIAGTYNLVVKDANGCTFTTTATLTDAPGPTAIATTLTNTTCGNPNGSVVLGAVTGGTASYTYSFNGSGFTATTTYSALAAGTYPIVVKDANGCTYTTSATLTNTPGPTALATSITNSTCGNSNGTITIGATTGGTAPYSYSFNAGGFTATTSYTGLAAATYPIIVKDANGCTFTVNPAVANTPGPTALATSTTSSTCGGANGAITIGAATGGTAPYTYSVNGSAFTSSTSYTGLAANSYPIIVKDANGCQFTTSATITDLSGLTASETHVDVFCNGGSTGSITATATGSTAPYSYSLNGGAFVAGGTFNGLAIGTYTVTAKDGNGCTVPLIVTINQPSVLAGVIASQTDVSCFGLSNGAVSITASGGTTPYTYSIDGGTFGTSASFTGLPAGSHPVIVKDAKGCTANVSVTIIQPIALTLATSSVNSVCTASNGSATVVASGGTPNYTYVWSPLPGSNATLNNIPAGNYSVVVTDNNACSQTASVTVTANPGGTATISSTTNVTCTGANDGTATVSMGGASTPPFIYSWNPSSQTTTTAINLSPASYTVTVTDGNGCTASATTIITEPTVITSSFVTTDATCKSGNNGQSTVTAGGGTSPYTYSWLPGGQTTPTASGLVAGTYTVTITDRNGCTKTSSTTINEPTPIVLTSTHVDANCNQSNGSATVTATGGTGPYTYAWGTTPVQTSQTATNLPANSYLVTVTDANTCTQTLVATISDLAGPVATLVSSSNVSCFGLSDGNAITSVNGGTSPYIFSWNNGQSLPTATNLAAGTYTMTATDQNGCIASVSATITEPTQLVTTYTPTNPSCFGGNNGSINTNTNGGTIPYTYLWSPGSASTSNLSNLTAGTYSLQVTDSKGCTTLTPVTLTQPVANSATASSQNVTCSGLCNGTATAIAGSGNGPFTYLWNDPNAQTTQIATGLCGGTYSVTVTDANGCTALATTGVSVPNAMVASITAFGDVSCYNACDGFAQSTVNGGTAPYNYMWAPGGTAGSSVNNLCAATYTVTVTDANGCTATTSQLIRQPNPLVASITNTDVTCFGMCDAQATAVYTGGTGPYTFIWTPSMQTTPTVLNLCAGVQTMIITDSHNCTANATVVIEEPTALSVSTTTTASNCGNADGGACAQITGGTPPFIYSWNDPALQATSCATNLNANAYIISITDAHGCSVTNVANVNDINGPVVTIPTSTNVTCAGASNGTAQGNITGGTLPYSTVMWTPSGQTSSFASNLSEGQYSLVVTDAVGCRGSATVDITEPFPLVTSVTHTNATCNLVCDGAATVNVGGGTSPYVYVWNDPGSQTTATANNLCAQTYTVTVTDSNGCVSTSSTIIDQPSPVNITANTVTNVSCNGGANGAIATTVTGGTPGYSYLWTPSNQANTQATNLSVGTYTLLVTDAHQCTQTLVQNITEPSALVLTPNSNPSRCGNSNGSAGVSVSPGTGTAPYTYFWSPTALTSAIIPNVSAGSYTVTVTDFMGCTTTSTSIVSDLSGPTINNVTYSAPLCYNTPTGTANASVSGGQLPYVYSWSNSAGPIGQNAAIATALVDGTYNVTVTDLNGCIATGSVIIPDALPVTILPIPTDTICIGQSSQVFAAASGGTPNYAYTWNPTFSQPGPIYNVSPTSTTVYSVTAIDDHGCLSNVQTATVFVHPQIVVIASDTSVCSGKSVPISATATGGTGGPYTYSWSNGASTQTQTVTPTGTGNVNYIVTANDIGCSTAVKDTSTVTVNPLPFSSMNTLDTAGCDRFNASFIGNSNGVSYLWNFGDGSTSALQNPSHVYTTVGGVLTSYNVSLTVTSALGCTSLITSNGYIDVYPTPTAGFSTSPTDPTTTSPVVSFTDQSTGATAWDWDFIYTTPPLGLYTDTMQNPTYSYPDSGAYVVQQIVSNNYGCYDTAYNTVEIIPEYILYTPNAFTPFNHDGINDKFMPKGLGIDPDNFEMMIFDRWGNLIFKTNDLSQGWDGKANGGSKIAQIDVYVWKIVTKDFAGVNHNYIGHVSIVK